MKMKIEIKLTETKDHAYCYIPFLDQYIYGKDLNDVKSAINSMEGKRLGTFGIEQTR